MPSTNNLGKFPKPTEQAMPSAPFQPGGTIEASVNNSCFWNLYLPVTAFVNWVASKDTEIVSYEWSDDIDTMQSRIDYALTYWNQNMKEHGTLHIYADSEAGYSGDDYFEVNRNGFLMNGDNRITVAMRYGVVNEDYYIHSEAVEIEDNCLLTKKMVEGGYVNVPKAANADTLGNTLATVGSTQLPVYFTSGKPSPVADIVVRANSDNVPNVRVEVAASGSQTLFKTAGIRADRTSATQIPDPYMYKSIVNGNAVLSYVYQLPNKTGTFALTSDVQSARVQRQMVASISDLEDLYLAHRTGILKIIWINELNSGEVYQYDCSAVWHNTGSGEGVVFYYFDGSTMKRLSSLSVSYPVWVMYID